MACTAFSLPYAGCFRIPRAAQYMCSHSQNIGLRWLSLVICKLLHAIESGWPVIARRKRLCTAWLPVKHTIESMQWYICFVVQYCTSCNYLKVDIQFDPIKKGFNPNFMVIMSTVFIHVFAPHWPGKCVLEHHMCCSCHRKYMFFTYSTLPASHLWEPLKGPEQCSSPHPFARNQRMQA